MADQKKTKVTIDDVAKNASVSKTTISRYLNGKYEYMSGETKNTIQKVIEELGYRPSMIARSLKSQKSGIVGCVIADITNPFSSYIVKGINDVCKKSGYQVLFVNTDDNKLSEIESIRSLMDNKLDGIIVNATGHNDDYLVEIQNQGMPIVMADRCLKKKKLIDTVTSQNYTSTYECIQFLQKQGYTKVALFTQELGEISSRHERHNGYIDAMTKIFGMDGNDYTYFIDSNDISVCINNLRRLKEENSEDEIGIFTVNGVTLMNVLTAMSEANYIIGKDFGICGFDDWGWASLIPPGITTITQDSYSTGVKAAEVLINRIENGITNRKNFIELPTRLIPRGSTIPYKSN